jgi:hypothetical protein
MSEAVQYAWQFAEGARLETTIRQILRELGYGR